MKAYELTLEEVERELQLLDLDLHISGRRGDYIINVLNTDRDIYISVGHANLADGVRAALARGKQAVHDRGKAEEKSHES